MRYNPAFLSRNAETDDRAECHRIICVRLVPSRGDISLGSARTSLLAGKPGLEGDCGSYTFVAWTECAVVMMKRFKASSSIVAVF
jgi:hypothetical protein